MPIIEKLIFKENLVSVEFENSEIFNISYEAYTQYRLSSGMNITGDAYTEIVDESARISCREKALGYLAMRARSVDETAKYLKKKKFSDRHINEAIEYLKSKGYLDDFEFASAFVKVRKSTGRYGKDLIAKELFRKGLGRKIIAKAIKEGGADEPDMESLFSLALKKYKSVKEKDNSFAKVGNYLRQRGFEYDSISKVLRMLKEHENINDKEDE